MGVWGAGPFDNDTAGNMIAELMDPILRVLDLPLSVPRKNRYRGKSLRHIASDYYTEARISAAFVLLAHGTDILGGPSLWPVLEALKKMRSDTEWLAIWKQGEGKRKPVRATDIVKALDSQIRAVQRKIRICCNKKKRVKSVRRRGRVLCRKQ